MPNELFKQYKCNNLLKTFKKLQLIRVLKLLDWKTTVIIVCIFLTKPYISHLFVKNILT